MMNHQLHAVYVPQILLVFAHAGQAGVLGARLAWQGYRIVHATGIVQALELLRQHHFDAMVADDVLALASDAVLLLDANESTASPALSVFVMTEHPTDEKTLRILQYGADDVMHAQVNFDILLLKLRRSMNQTQHATPTPTPAKRHVSANKVLELPPFPRQEPAAMQSHREGDDVRMEPTGVMGSLKQMALTEIVQSLELGQKTALIDVLSSSGEQGQVGVVTGEVCFAQVGERNGPEAFFALAQVCDGLFRIHYGSQLQIRNIETGTTHLLLETMRRLDESSPVSSPETVAEPWVPDPKRH